MHTAKEKWRAGPRLCHHARKQQNVMAGHVTLHDMRWTLYRWKLLPYASQAVRKWPRSASRADVSSYYGRQFPMQAPSQLPVRIRRNCISWTSI